MNRSSYDAIVQEWDATRVRMATSEKRLLDLALEGVSPGQRVLDLGCGTGRPIGEYVVSRGFAITGVDQAPALLGLARGRMPGENWIQSRLEDFEPEGFYDAAVAWDSLFHIPRAQHAAIVGKVRGSLRAGSRFALTVGGSQHPAFIDTMFGHEFFYDSHPPEVTVGVLEEVGFKLIHAEFLNPPTSGRDKGRYAIVASAV